MKMKNIVLTIILSFLVFSLIVCSCATGYSKKTYIESFEQFVCNIEDNWKTFTEDDWAKIQERMESFSNKTDKYSKKYTEEDSVRVNNLEKRYRVVERKYTVKKEIDDVLDGVNDWFDRNEDYLELLLKVVGLIKSFE